MKLEIEIPDEMWGALGEVTRTMPALGSTPEELIQRVLEPALASYGQRFLRMPPAIESIKQQLDNYMKSVSTPIVRKGVSASIADGRDS